MKGGILEQVKRFRYLGTAAEAEAVPNYYLEFGTLRFIFLSVLFI